MSEKKPRRPWFIWLSLLGLVWLHAVVSRNYAISKTKYGDRELNLWLGYVARLLGMMLGVLILPYLLMQKLLDLAGAPFTAAGSLLILGYLYFAGVFVTYRLDRYLTRRATETTIYHKERD